jgi:glycosyltransferase involved in cell wall biosynthesis
LAAERLHALLSREQPDRFVYVVHQRDGDFQPHPQARLNVGRARFGTDRLPRPWVSRCNAMDEIWVLSTFNVETFRRAGVRAEKLRQVPASLSPDLYDTTLPPLELPGLAGFVYLSVLNWSPRKGWDALVRAYVTEFSRDEGVSLALKVLPGGKTTSQLRDDIDRFVRQELGRDPRTIPPIALLDMQLGVQDMPRLYRSADAYVMPSRGEGWGRAYMEAMAMGLPTIGTRWGGNLDFMTDANAYLIDATLVNVPEVGWREVPHYRGHRWAEPSVEHLRSLMRRVFERRDEAVAKAALARSQILAAYRWERVAALLIERLAASGVPIGPHAATLAAPPSSVERSGHGPSTVPGSS